MIGSGHNQTNELWDSTSRPCVTDSRAGHQGVLQVTIRPEAEANPKLWSNHEAEAEALNF